MSTEQEKISLPEQKIFLVNEKARHDIHRVLDRDKNFEREFYYANKQPFIRGTSRYKDKKGNEISFIWIPERKQFLVTCSESMEAMVENLINLSSPNLDSSALC